MKSQWLTLRRLAIIFGAAALLGTVTGYLVDREFWAFVEPFQTLIQVFYANVSTAMLSIAVIIVLIDTLNERRAIAQEKRRLVLQMGSDNYALAKEAVRILRIEGWGFWEEATLQGASLYRADLHELALYDVNLQRAGLSRANLQGADLGFANLQRANLTGANLQEAYLLEANLERATLRRANLQGAELTKANLQRVILTGANLRGAWLVGADLREAVMRYEARGEIIEAELDEETKLPDGSLWTPETDMICFTDPSRPDFWQGYSLSHEDLRNRDFRQANIQGAYLEYANLQETNLREANLQGAVLHGANLKGADLLLANLQGASLREVDLQEANLTEAKLDEKTTLPDGSRWRPDTDMCSFTDPNHLDFWRSDYSASPAYWGEDGG